MRGGFFGVAESSELSCASAPGTEQVELLWCSLPQGSLVGFSAGVKSLLDLGLNIQKSLSSGSGFQIWSQNIREEELPVWVVVCKRTFEYLVLPRK